MINCTAQFSSQRTLRETVESIKGRDRHSNEKPAEV